METTKTNKEIIDEIDRICKNADNFTSDNYGSEAADNGIYEVSYSEYSAKNTLITFVEWLLKEK